MQLPPVEHRATPANVGVSLTDRIGGTPLVPIDGLEGVPNDVRVLGKAEWFNPGGSVKDRAGWSIVRAAEASGALAPGTTLLDATSGNTGIAYAWIGAARGFPVRLCVPANVGTARRQLLEAFGARLTLTDPMDGTDGAIREARAIAERDGARVYYADQYSNPENWRAHYRGTAEELWRETEGAITHLVAGIGTSGTLVGTARRLRELNPDLVAVAVQPDGPLHVMEGLKHLPSCRVPAIYDASVHQRTIEVRSEDAIDLVRRQAKRGLAMGWSAGAAVVAAERLARTLTSGAVVAILPDGAERYTADPLWRETVA